jgi:hypothetical protein
MSQENAKVLYAQDILLFGMPADFAFDRKNVFEEL